MENVSQMSMLEVAVMLMEKKKTPQPIRKLIEEALQVKGIDESNTEVASQLYVDITTSSKFVYMGDEEWDLKSRQSLDEWDKDGSAFNTADLDDEDDNGLTEKDYDLEEDKSSYDDDDEDEDSNYSDSDDDDDSSYDEYDDDDTSDNDEFDTIRDNPDEDTFDEDDYDEIMDDYEDLYDKK